ncbi:MAG: hypothetical protein D6780_02080 [Candidatus Dadabacteria bacterium]|nr:MAG: hypothetical protein D6780_02080 [Candidatus Dadabacteria bacterium]
MKRIIVILFSTVFFLALDAYSQVPPKEAKKFYKKGFVSSSKANKHKLFNKKEGKQERKASSKKETTQLKQNNKNVVEVDVYEKGVPVRSISVFVDGVNFSHIKKSLNEALKVSKQYNKPIAGLFMLMHKFNDPLAEKVLDFAAESNNTPFLPLFSMPDWLKEVKVSPAYIIDTDEGLVLIEGEVNLARFFNSKGELLLTKGDFYSRDHKQHLK